LYDAISNNNKNFLDIEQAQQYLSEKLTGRNYLLVLDDVWHRIDAENILKAAGKCTVLITTRMDKMLENAKQEHVDEMTKDEAVAQLSNFTGTGNAAHNELAALAEKLGHWALLLRLTGAQLKARIDEGETLEKAIAFVNKRLERKGLFSFDKTDAAQRNDSVAICLAASIDLLNKEDQQKLYSLGIFPEDENIPYTVLEKYWDLDDFDCEELLEKFHRYGLIDLDVPGRTVKMHDILLKYYGTCENYKPEKHLLLVKSLGKFDTWKDKYAWQWCIWHLAEAGAFEEATQLLTDYSWIEAKLIVTGNLYDVVSDYKLITVTDDLTLIQKALLLSAAVISEDTAQLPHQLFGRLRLLQQPVCRHLAEQAARAIGKRAPSLKPLYPNLEIPDLYNLVFRGHSIGVAGALMHDETLISWSFDNTLRSWDIDSGETKHVFEGHSAPVKCALIQGETLISWSYDHTLRSWDIASGSTKHVFEAYIDSIYGGALIQGETLISWSHDNTLRSWDIDSGETKQVFEGHSASVMGALIQGETLISWSHDNTLRSWDIDSGETKQVFEGHSASVTGALIQGETLISWSEDKTYRSWDIDSGETKQVFEGHSKFINGALIQGETLISWSHDNTLRSWDIDSGKIKQVFEGHSASVMGALIQGETLISWSHDNTLHSWDIDSSETKQVFEGHSASVMGALIQGETLISWSGDYTLRSWDIDSGKTKQVFEGHSASVMGALIRGETLISWSGDKTLRSWGIDSGKAKPAIEGHLGSVNGALIQGETLVSLSHDKTLRAWILVPVKPNRFLKGTHPLLRGH
jgi:WD40 repeat protein